MSSGLKTLFFVFFLGALMSFLSRMYYLKNNPERITRRKEDGSIHWKACIFINTLEVVIGGMVALGAYATITHFQLVEGDLAIVMVGAISTASGKIFELVQQITYKQVSDRLDKINDL